MLREGRRAPRIDAEHARAHGVEVGVADGENRFVAGQLREASLERAGKRLLSGAAHGALVIYCSQQRERRSLGKWLLHVEQTAWAEHPCRLGKRRIHQSDGNVVKAVEEDHDVKARIGKWQPLGCSLEITRRRRGGVRATRLLKRASQWIDTRHPAPCRGEPASQSTLTAADVEYVAVADVE